MKIRTMAMTETIRDRIAEFNPEAILFDDLDDAIIGVGHQHGTTPVAIYDREKCIEILADKFAEHGSPKVDHLAEAIEWFEFNIGCAYVGEHTPIFLEKLDVQRD